VANPRSSLANSSSGQPSWSESDGCASPGIARVVKASLTSIASVASATLSPAASAISSTVGSRPSSWMSSSRRVATRVLASCSPRGMRTAHFWSRNMCMISPSMVRAA
jgi:hypothetical protein